MNTFPFYFTYVQEGRKKNRVYIVKRMDIEIDDDGVAAVPFVSDRRGFNCGKLAGIVREVLNDSAAEKIAMENFKDATINDNHLYRLREPTCTPEIARYFTGATNSFTSEALMSFRCRFGIDRRKPALIHP